MRRRGLLLAALAFTLALNSEAWCMDLPSAVAKVKPSILLVGTYAELDSPRFTFRGTGFVVADGNTMLTNAHVLPAPGATGPSRRLAVQVPAPDGKWELREAELLRLDRVRDLAALRFRGRAVPALAIAPSGFAREGMSIAFTGFPIGGVLGFSPVTHRGIISAITAIVPPGGSGSALSPRAVQQLREGSFEVLQLDATAYPGNSGGPVYDVETGLVVGIVNMVFVKAGRESVLSQPSGISYAIPVYQALQMLERAD